MNAYDVFLSFKNLDEDGVPTKESFLARELYEFLTAKGLRVFFSNVSLEQLGVSAYKKAIDDALDSAQILVAVGTSASNLNSQWVRYEWDSFVTDILNDSKPNGRVFAYIHDLEILSLPRALRQSQTIHHATGSTERLCNFIVNGLQGKSKDPVVSVGSTQISNRNTAADEREPYSDINDILDLSKDDCPLLGAPELVDEFNRILGKTRTSEERHLLPPSELREVVEQLFTIRELMTRPHFRIGFVGAAQVGKSSVLNAILDQSNHEERILPEGAGRICSAVSTRIYCTPGASNTLRLRYMTPDQYVTLRESLCTMIGIDPALPDTMVLKSLANQEINSVENFGIGSNEACKSLRQVLESFKCFGDECIRSKAVIQAVPYRERMSFLSVNSDESPSRMVLAREAEITLNSDTIPKDVTFIDVPTPLADYRFREVFHSLDGLIVFVNCARLDDDIFVTMPKELRKNGCVRVVLTRIDAFSSSIEPEEFFDHLRKFLTMHDILEEHVHFVSVPQHNSLKRYAVEGCSNDRSAIWLGGSSLDHFRGLQKSVDEYRTDSGVDFLRNTVAVAIPDQLRSLRNDQIRSSIEAQKNRFRRF